MHGLNVARSSGNVVLSGVAPPEHFDTAGVAVRYVAGTVAPRHTDMHTRAVVLVAEDAATAMRRAEALRTWAHESLLPIIALVERERDVEHPGLWRQALTCASLREAGHVLRLMAELNRNRDGLPTVEDAHLTWDLRRQLRHGSASRFGVGLDAFVVGDQAFVGGLLRADVDVDALSAALDVPASVSLNTTAVRTVRTRSQSAYLHFAGAVSASSS